MNAETKCKNCGFALGFHSSVDNSCPDAETVGELTGLKIPCWKPNSFFDCDELPPVVGKKQSVNQPENKVDWWPKKFESRQGLRKVIFSRWLSAKDKEYWKLANPEDGPVPSKEMDLQGYFHGWGNAYEEFEAGPGNYSIAIVEGESGQIFEVLPSDVKFLS